MAKRNDILKQKARVLRHEGLSYDKIFQKIGVAKSTLNYWFRDLPRSPYQRDPRVRRAHLARVRPLAANVIRAKRNARLMAAEKKAIEEVSQFPLEDKMVQKSLLALLYWAEGAKTHPSGFKFANTDPALALLFLTLLRGTIPIDEKKIKIYLHCHHYHNIAEIRKFWSKVLDVPISQFAKVHLKSRKKTKRKRKNFAGICFIRYGKGAEELKQELLSVARAIQARITKPCPHSSIG